PTGTSMNELSESRNNVCRDRDQAQHSQWPAVAGSVAHALGLRGFSQSPNVSRARTKRQHNHVQNKEVFVVKQHPPGVSVTRDPQYEESKSRSAVAVPLANRSQNASANARHVRAYDDRAQQWSSKHA